MLKYLLIFTLIWAVTQTPSPVPEKALDSASQTAGSFQNQGKNDKGNPTSSDGSGWGLYVVGVLQALLFTVTWIAIRQQASTQKDCGASLDDNHTGQTGRLGTHLASRAAWCTGYPERFSGCYKECRADARACH